VFRLSRIFKNYAQTGSLAEQVNLHGFVGPQAFLTKTGEVGVILEVKGVDYECLDDRSIDGLTKRLESALKLFDENCRVYQYLFKRSNETIPYKLYANPVVDAAIKNRIAYLGSKADTLFSFSVYYVVLYRGFEASQRLGDVLREFSKSPKRGFGELAMQLSSKRRVVVLGEHVDRAQSMLLQKAHNFILQVSDFSSVRVLDKQEAFRVLKRTLNFSPHKLDLAKLKYDTFLDYYLPESHLECHRRLLRIDDYYVKVLTLKEPAAQSFPLIFKRLLEVEANYHVVTEWKKEDSGKTRRTIQAKRRHFHNTKRSFFSQVNMNDAPPQDMLMDDSKESRVRELGEGVQEIELRGNYFGLFSLTVVIYDLDLGKVDRACAEFYKVFSVHDAQLYEERYNLLNAFLAAVPGNHAFNLRYLYLLNTNYADFSFLFTLNRGEPRNAHLRQEYLAVLETNHHTPYFLNLHYRDVAHSMILGRTGAGKFFSLSRQPKCIPIIATQSISSLKSSVPGEAWRTLLQTFRTKIFLSLSDDFSARTASELCGREDRLKVSYNLSESGHDASISLLTGKAISHKANLTTSKNYVPHSDFRFDTKTFTELKNAQAVVIAYDGLNPLPPAFCYLKPCYNDPNKTYFRQLQDGQL
jgi:type IV secretory system conjugative DNA transfer VirD4/TraG family protein